MQVQPSLAASLSIPRISRSLHDNQGCGVFTSMNQTYQVLARAAGAYHRCVAAKNSEWETRWKEQIESIVADHFPRGSGFDSGTKLDIDESHDDRLVFATSFHHMNEDGMYDGWTEHMVIVTPSLGLDFRLKVTGRNRNEIKEYICECFSESLSTELPDTSCPETRKIETADI